MQCDQCSPRDDSLCALDYQVLEVSAMQSEDAVDVDITMKAATYSATACVRFTSPLQELRLRRQETRTIPIRAPSSSSGGSSSGVVVEAGVLASVAGLPVEAASRTTEPPLQKKKQRKATLLRVKIGVRFRTRYTIVHAFKSLFLLCRLSKTERGALTNAGIRDLNWSDQRSGQSF